MTTERLESGPDAAPMARRELRAMNSEITLVCCQADAERLLDRAERWLAAFEERFSRFRVLGELNRLNGSAGRPFRASPGLFRLIRVALDFAERSDGLFDPTVLRQLEASGYDRSFDLLPPASGASLRATPRFSWQDVRIDPATRSVLLPRGCGIDLGGIGKGYAVDRLASMLGTPCLVNGGGDVFGSGRPPTEGAWNVGVADPFTPERDITVLAVCDRGVATSSSLKRRWQRGGMVMHHLIDPRTGRPSTSDAVQVTVVAPSTLLADYHAKVALLKGATGGLAYMESEVGVEGVVVRTDGDVGWSEGLRSYVVAPLAR